MNSIGSDVGKSRGNEIRRKILKGKIAFQELDPCFAFCNIGVFLAVGVSSNIPYTCFGHVLSDEVDCRVLARCITKCGSSG